MSNSTALPYSDIFVSLLAKIHRAIEYCHTSYTNGEELKETDKYLENLFIPIDKKYSGSGLNNHLTKGLNKTIQERQGIYPRLSKLVIYHYLQTQNVKKKVIIRLR